MVKFNKQKRFSSGTVLKTGYFSFQTLETSRYCRNSVGPESRKTSYYDEKLEEGPVLGAIKTILDVRST